jgi:spermidine synthase
MSKQEIYRNLRFVHREKSEFQDIRVYDSESLGRILVLDRAIQIASKCFAEDNYSKTMIETVLRQKEGT